MLSSRPGCLALASLLALGMFSVTAPAAPGASAPVEAAPPAEAHFVVRDAVRIARPRPIGMNVHLAGEYRPWTGHGEFNLWSRGGHPEAFYTVQKGVATGGGEDHLENRERPFASFRGRFGDGFFEGARLRVYRYEGDTCRLLRVATVSGFAGGGEESPNRFTFHERGPRVQAGDEYVVERRSTTPGPGLEPARSEQADLLAATYAPRPAGTTVALDASCAAPSGGRASLRVDFPAAGEVRLGPWYPVPRGPGSVRYDAAATFQFAGWFRQAEAGPGRLRVRCAGLAERTFDLGPAWQEIRFTFPGGPADRERTDLEIGLTGRGTLWMDNFTVTEVTPRARPMGFDADMVKALKAMRPGFLRIWTLQANQGSALPLEELVTGYFTQPWIVDDGRVRTFAMVDLHAMLELCEEVGTDPWLIVSTFYPPESWVKLIEYLAGPPDTPMGALRAARGRPEPWTAAFDHLWLELGNEVWNGMFQPQGFAGRARDYSRYADLMFAAARRAPHFDPDRMQLVANGFINSLDGYTRTVATSSTQADFIDVANYIGGWEAGATDTAASGDRAFESRLLYGVTTGRDTVRGVAAMLEKVAALRARPIRGAVYEAGPGYSLPGAGVPVDEDEQRLGHSLASAIGTLDLYFAYTLAGMDLIGHFTFGRGLYWRTHAETQGEWRSHAVTLACELRNHYGAGDLLVVDEVAVPTVDLAAREILRKRNDGSLARHREPARPGVPLVGCHAFREGSQFSVFLISRAMSGQTRVRLDLPWAVAGPLTCARLAGTSPRAHNLDGADVRIETNTEAVCDLSAITLPAHSVLVLHGRLAAAASIARSQELHGMQSARDAFDHLHRPEDKR